MQTNTKMIYQHERRLHLLGSANDNLGTETYSSMYLQVSSSYGLNARGRYHTTASWPLLHGMQGAFIVGKTASCWSQWKTQGYSSNLGLLTHPRRSGYWENVCYITNWSYVPNTGTWYQQLGCLSGTPSLTTSFVLAIMSRYYNSTNLNMYKRRL